MTFMSHRRRELGSDEHNTCDPLGCLETRTHWNGPYRSLLFVCALVCEQALVLLCYLVVISRAEEDVVSSRVPLDEADPAAVTLKLLPWDCEVLQQPMRGDFPHFYLRAHTHTTHTHALLK